MMREISDSARLCTLMVHSPSHNSEELLLNPELFSDLTAGDYIQIFDPQNPEGALILKVPTMSPISSRLEISLTKVVAESNNLKPFIKVVVEKIDPESATLHFVELSFKRQYLQRGNFFRFQNEMVGRPIYLNQNITINGIQAQIQELRKDYDVKRSGIVNDRTKFVFRSRSARIIWLVQISAEMWEFDQNGDLYFEKFLRDFVSPLLDKWKALGVSHMLTVVFFSRTFFLERITSNHNPELYSKKSFGQTTDGFQFQDSFKIVIENIAEFDQHTQINRLRQEFWEYPKRLGWRIPVHLLHYQRQVMGKSNACSNNPENSTTNNPNTASTHTHTVDPTNTTSTSSITAGSNTQQLPSTTTSSEVTYAVPSDAVHGNFLEAINMALNILSKHYLDRDLTRTNNSIVMISAGGGIFKVRPNLNQITKQRMLDNAFGIDFISLARPIVDTVPLFLVDCRNEGVKNFYETPHWLRVSYIDCHREVSEALEATHQGSKASSTHGDSADAIWGKTFMLQPTASLLTAQLENSGDLKQLAAAYANTLPLPLREIMTRHSAPGTFSNLPSTKPGTFSNSTELSSAAIIQNPTSESSGLTSAQTLVPVERNLHSPTAHITSTPTSVQDPAGNPEGSETKVSVDLELDALFNTGAPPIPTWGTVASIPFLLQPSTLELSKKTLGGYNPKSTIMIEDLLALKSLALTNTASGVKATTAGAGTSTGASTTKNKLREVIEELPILQRDRGDSYSLAGSLTSAFGEGTDEESELGHRPTGKFITGSSLEEEDRLMRLYDCRHNRSSMRSAAASLEQSSYGDHYLGDMLRSHTAERFHTRTLPTCSVNLVALVEDLKERQSTLVEISNTQSILTQEKLLEMMTNHDRNIFRGRSQFTHSTSTNNIPSLDASNNTTNATSTIAASTTASTTITGMMPTTSSTSTTDNPLPSALSSTATASSSIPGKVGETSNTTGGRVSVPTVSFQSNLTEEVRKPSQAPLTKDQKLRAHLLSHSSQSQSAARLKQMQLQQQMTQMQGTSTSTGNRVLSAVAQQQQRAQQEDIDTSNSKPVEARRSNLASGKFISPSKLASHEGDSSRSELTKGGGGVSESAGLTPLSTADQHKKNDINSNIDQKSSNTVKFNTSTTNDTITTTNASAHSTTAKKYQRLSNRSFMGAKALAAMTSGGRPSPEMSRARNANAAQQFAIIHGKIVPIHAGGDNDAKLKSEQYAQYIREYSQTHCVNPFRVRDSQSYSHSQSHNRRRWIHVFPQGTLSNTVDYSLNWKSLTQPAILPLTTDFVPSIKTMGRYDVNNFYQLIVQKDESPFSSAEDLMKELICLRLTQEYQVIEDFDPAIYRNFNKSADSSSSIATSNLAYYSSGTSTPSTATTKRVHNILLGNTPSLRRMDSVNGKSKEMKNFYILSMGHRIHFMQYDGGGVNVTIYRSKEGQIEDDEKSVFSYSYESWNPQFGAFITMSQNFYKFSSEEFRWNKLDNIIVGNNPVDTSENAMKMKRLKYTILPPEIYTEEDMLEYFNKIDLLIEFFNKYAQAGDDQVTIQKDKTCIDLRNENENNSSNSIDYGRRSSSSTSSVEKSRVNSNASVASNSSGTGNGMSVVAASAIHLVTQTAQAIALYRKTDARHCDVAKLVMRTSKQGNPNWLYCRYDRTAYTYKSFHLEFHWVVCDSWLIDDMLTLLYRRCQKWGLRLCQVPQYYSTEDLNVHPFRALPYIPVTKSQRESIPGVFPTPLRMVERLLFSRRNGWLFDNEYRTDWTALGLSVPSYLDRDRDLITSDVLESPDPSQIVTPTTQPPTPADPTATASAQPKPHAFSSLSQSLSRMVFRQEEAGASAAASATGAAALAVGMTKSPFVRKSANRKLDRQYMFHTGLAVVRVAAQGFLWMQNTASKVSDINLPTDERRDSVAKNFDMVTEYCDKIPMCYDICIDIVERAIEYAQFAQIANEVIEDCISDAFTQLAHKALQQSLLVETASRQASQESSAVSSPFSPTTTDHTPSALVSVGNSTPVTPKLDMIPPISTTTTADDIRRSHSHSQEMTETPLSEVSPSSAHSSKVFDPLTSAISFMSSPTESPRSGAHRTSAAPSGDYTDIDPTTEPFPHMVSESTDMAVITERAHTLPCSASSESLSLSSVSSLRPCSTASADGGSDHASVFTTVEAPSTQQE